ncbi:hypothetical protein [Spiroplasma poulsonii]|uniref:hypothetical protein n=1 Tax=Spiroplasma poulsonii TaxID=2138 RepID=UPI001F4D0501|nr:hypothetical protein [Spiroplasma poulsonii]UNF61468.1 hypothetical protein MNU24_06010 [Spiroplasma poulsonii]
MIILMIKLLCECYWNSNPTPKKNKSNLILGKEKHTIKTQVIIEQEIKNYCNKFSLGKKHDYALFKESKSQFLKYQN